MSVHLSEHFNYKKLLVAVLPSILMMLFTSIYTIVDGLFISNFVGKTAFASVNLIFPVVMVMGAIGFMLGQGGSALVSKTLGEKDKKKAHQIFSMIIYFTILIGLVLSLCVIFFVEPIARLLGATDNMIEDSVKYGKILIEFNVLYMLQNVFQSFFVVAERPILGFFITFFSGVGNIILDALFVGALKLGLSGAAWATVISYVIGAALPLIYFASKNKSLLKLVRVKLNFRYIIKACFNGISELFTNISISIVTMLYNLQLLKYIGENGVAAYGVICYAGFIFLAIFFGYSLGASPIIAYNYGAKNNEELHNLFKKSLILTILTGIFLTFLTEVLANPLSRIFVSYDKELLELTIHGFRLYSISFMIVGINIFSSAFFTALNNGLISGIISFARTFVFNILTILIMPIFFGINGIWLAVVVTEALALVISIMFLVLKRKSYNY